MKMYVLEEQEPLFHSEGSCTDFLAFILIRQFYEPWSYSMKTVFYKVYNCGGSNHVVGTELATHRI